MRSVRLADPFDWQQLGGALLTSGNGQEPQLEACFLAEQQQAIMDAGMADVPRMTMHNAIAIVALNLNWISPSKLD